jgi:hypothetical protein
VTKSRRIRWASHLAHIEGRRNTNKILAGKTKGKIFQGNKKSCGKKDVKTWVILI